MAIYKKTVGKGFKSLRTDHLQTIQPLEVGNGEYMNKVTVCMARITEIFHFKVAGAII